MCGFVITLSLLSSPRPTHPHLSRRESRQSSQGERESPETTRNASPLRPAPLDPSALPRPRPRPRVPLLSSRPPRLLAALPPLIRAPLPACLDAPLHITPPRRLRAPAGPAVPGRVLADKIYDQFIIGLLLICYQFCHPGAGAAVPLRALAAEIYYSTYH